jgi:pullulanase/glycogen debranching enzyme
MMDLKWLKQTRLLLGCPGDFVRTVHWLAGLQPAFISGKTWVIVLNLYQEGNMSDLIGSHRIGNELKFKVWAPHANKLDVLVQQGTEWDYDTEPRRYSLEKNHGDYWEGKFRDISAGEIYRYEISNNGRKFVTIDPAARDTVHSWNYSIENNAMRP